MRCQTIVQPFDGKGLLGSFATKLRLTCLGYA